MSAGTTSCTLRLFVWGAVLCSLGGCATAPLESAGSLASYDGLRQSDGIITHAKLRIDKQRLLDARTATIVGTAFSASPSVAGLSDKQKLLVSNAINRSLCLGLSERFHIVPPGQPADVSIRAVVTHVTPTNVAVAGVSNVVGMVPMFLSLNYPVPVPRIPVGLGTLSVEADAKDLKGTQVAAMLWARGATSASGKARLSEAGDPYELANDFSDDFSKMLVTGDTPFEKKLPSLPTLDRITTKLGGKPKESACEAYGSEGGIPAMIGGSIGLPPEWTDVGPPAPKKL